MNYRVVTNGSNLNLRQSASTDVSSFILDSIPNGTIVPSNSVLAAHENWTAVTYNGQAGYVLTQYIQPTEESTTQNNNNLQKTNEQNIMGLTLSENAQKILKYGIICLGVVVIGGVVYKMYTDGQKKTYVPVSGTRKQDPLGKVSSRKEEEGTHKKIKLK